MLLLWLLCSLLLVSDVAAVAVAVAVTVLMRLPRLLLESLALWLSDVSPTYTLDGGGDCADDEEE